MKSRRLHGPAAIERSGKLETQRAHVEEVQRVRMDPMLDPGKRLMLASGDASRVEGRLLDSEAASSSGDALVREASKSSMMPRRYERLVVGSLFVWRVSVTTHSDLERDAFLTALAAFLYEPVVGGKKGTGHGRLRAIDARGLDVRRPADRASVVDVSSLGTVNGALFRAHVGERSAKIREWLGKVDA
jgi:hypothetical protein